MISIEELKIGMHNILIIATRLSMLIKQYHGNIEVLTIINHQIDALTEYKLVSNCHTMLCS